MNTINNGNKLLLIAFTIFLFIIFIFATGIYVFTVSIRRYLTASAGITPGDRICGSTRFYGTTSGFRGGFLDKRRTLVLDVLGLEVGFKWGYIGVM